MMWLHFHMALRLVAIVSCMGKMGVRHLVMSGMSRNGTVSRSNCDDDPDITPRALAMQGLGKTRVAVLCYDSVLLKAFFICKSAPSNSVVLLSNS